MIDIIAQNGDVTINPSDEKSMSISLLKNFCSTFKSSFLERYNGESNILSSTDELKRISDILGTV